jgi:hypothetical protein
MDFKFTLGLFAFAVLAWIIVLGFISVCARGMM